VRVVAVQYRAVKGEVDRSLAALCRLADGHAAGADLVVLPEMAATGYVFPDRDAVWAVAEPADGPTCRALAAVARARRCWIVGGFPERSSDKIFNSALVINPSGERVFTYRKTLLYSEDLHWAEPGDSGYRCFETDKGTFGVGICMDLNDDQFIAWLAAEQPTALAFPTNWVKEGSPVWSYWAWRLQSIRTALVAANTWGTDPPITFSGKSAILRGLTLHAWAEEDGNLGISATLQGA
jgi:N-carbamoylputrescine amidase